MLAEIVDLGLGVVGNNAHEQTRFGAGLFELDVLRDTNNDVLLQQLLFDDLPKCGIGFIRSHRLCESKVSNGFLVSSRNNDAACSRGKRMLAARWYT